MIEKNENISQHTARRLWNFLSTKIINVLSGWNNGDDIIILPESVRYALRYRNAKFTPEEWIALLDEKYGFLWVYICLKFYENNLQKLQEHLSEIFQWIRSWKSFSEYTKKLRIATLNLPKNLLVLGTKSAQVSRNGFSPMCEWIAQVFNESKKSGIPVLVAFSGLLWIKWIIEEMAPGEIFYIFFPKNVPEEAFLKVSCSESLIHLSHLHESSLREVFHDKDVILVDDTQKTGSTFDQAERRIKKFCEPRSTTKKSLVVTQKNVF